MTAKQSLSDRGAKAVSQHRGRRQLHSRGKCKAAPPPTPEPRSILVVDDMLSVRESLKKVLEQAGYRALLAADGKEALDHFDNDPVDLMLLDIGLPIQSGWETFERITLTNPLLPVIIITGQSDQFQVAKAAGAGAFMEKPLDVERLLVTITDLLAEPKETRLRRMCGLDKDVRHIPSHSALFLQHLKERLEAPYRFRSGDLLQDHHRNPDDDD